MAKTRRMRSAHAQARRTRPASGARQAEPEGAEVGGTARHRVGGLTRDGGDDGGLSAAATGIAGRDGPAKRAGTAWPAIVKARLI